MARKGNPFHADTPFGGRRAVDDSAELRRIAALPRRRWEDAYPEIPPMPAEVRAWMYRAITLKATDEQILGVYPQVRPYLHVLRLEAWLRQQSGKQSLRPIQVAALFEMYYNRGLLLSASVGAGKTLTSLLSFLVLESRRPLLLLPAKLIEKTHREAAKYRGDWLVPAHVRMVSYEKLGKPQHAKLLEEAQPDVIVADEAHKLKNLGGAAAKRVKRYVEANEHVAFVGMSGTIMKRSILDFSHMLRWALRHGKTPDGMKLPRSPLPVTFEDSITWSMALDQKRDEDGRTAPGALVTFCTPEEREQLSRVAYDEGLGVVRRAVMRRVMETPGVVATTSPMIGASLRVENIRLPLESADIIAAIEGLRERWDRPDGEPLLDAIELWRHMRSVGLGFYYRWNPAPPHIWRERRTVWSAYMRTILKTNRSHIDSPKQVVDAIDAGHYDGAILKEWREVKDLYDPEKNREAVWIDTAVLDFCGRWMLGKVEEAQGGIVWVEHTEFGHELSRRTGISYYGQGGFDAKGRFIEQHPPGQPLIASIASNSEGRNLQAWSTNLVTSFPANGKQAEQLLGRTHREGQEADEVVYQFITRVQEQLDSFTRARGDAHALTDMTGQPQKLTYCDIVIDEFGGAIKKHKKA